MKERAIYIKLFSFLTLCMFVLIMFIINPIIDSKDGMEVIKLQLAFDKKIGIEIINSWGKPGIHNFNTLIIADYIYAFCYAVFFYLILKYLIKKRPIKRKFSYILTIPFIAGVFDWLENTLELFFINNPIDFPNELFFFHSIIATLKWLCLPLVVWYIFNLSKKIQSSS